MLDVGLVLVAPRHVIQAALTRKLISHSLQTIVMRLTFCPGAAMLTAWS